MDNMESESRVAMAEVIEMDGAQVSTYQENELCDKKQEDYRKWKDNAIQLYDYINTSNLVWPSLTVQFFPDTERVQEKKRTKYRVLTGSFTSGQKEEYIQLSSVSVKSGTEEAHLAKYDSELEEFMSSDPISGKLSVDQKILHQGEVNRARCSPHKPDLISTINNHGEVFVFDKTKHSSQTSEDFKFDIKLAGHKKEGFGLCWNNHKEGTLLSSSMDGKTNLWDITKYKRSTTVIDVPAYTYITDTNGTNDVQWVHSHNSIFGAVGEDNTVKLFDTRTNQEVTKSDFSQHQDGINALSFNYEVLFCLATADSNGGLNVWDIRSFNEPVSKIQAHEGSISTISFNPNLPSKLLTAGADDNLVKIYDLSRDEDHKLEFIHAGHLLGINDAAWNPNDARMVASVSNDNTLHLWRPSKQFV